MKKFSNKCNGVYDVCCAVKQPGKICDTTPTCEKDFFKSIYSVKNYTIYCLTRKFGAAVAGGSAAGGIPNRPLPLSPKQTTEGEGL